jgi:serine/threonine protein kinase
MNDYFLFNNLFNKGFCTSNGVTKDFKVKLLGELRKAVEELHTHDFQVGDLNPYNILFSLKGDLLVVDVDSFQTKDKLHSMVLLQEIQDFTSTSITKQTDIWAYDILSFWTTTYCHPFKYIAKGDTSSLEQRVRQGKSILSKIPNIKIPALYEAPQGEVERQFRDVFGGRRYFVDFGNTISSVSMVVKQNITSTALTIRELLSNVTQVNVCADYISVRSNNEWHWVETKIPKVTRDILSTSDDQLYPCNANPVYVIGNTLFVGKSSQIEFVQPEFFYYNGFLTVIDYGTDLQHNFNLNNQLGGIDRTQTPVFAKSIVVRDTPIQNFGGKVFLNIPLNNTYTLVEVPLGTKNAVHNGVFYCTEHLENKQVKFRMGTIGLNIKMELDYLPYFTSKQHTLFMPEDGRIDVYKDFDLITSLDTTMCSRTSKLWSCNSGILLLENNVLYLLNTK